MGKGHRRFLLLAAVATVAMAPAPAHGQRVLTTGDSMMHVMFRQLTAELERYGASVTAEPRIGTGITKPDLLDWRAFAAEQAARVAPDVTVMFLGAGDVFPIEVGRTEYAYGTKGWRAAYERRVAAMLRSYLRGGRRRVYWLTLPTPRPKWLAKAFRTNDRVVAKAIRAAGSQAEVLDITPFVTAHGRYRRKLVVDGKRQAVRQLDGVHLAPAGARIAAQVIRAALQADGVLPAAPMR